MNYTLGYMLSEEIISHLEDRFDLFYEEIDPQHIKNVYKQMTNIKGNLSTLMKDEKNYAHRANKEQLNDGLYKLFTICISTDPWLDNVRQLCKLLYNWPAINNSMARMDENARKTGKPANYEVYRTSHGRFLEFHQFTEDELTDFAIKMPYLSKIYIGPYNVVTSIGAMMI